MSLQFKYLEDVINGSEFIALKTKCDRQTDGWKCGSDIKKQGDKKYRASTVEPLSTRFMHI